MTDAKARILDAAVTEFAKLGLAGARIDRIADSAHINKQRIYAYFGNKAALFDAAVAEGFRKLRVDAPIASGTDDLVHYAIRLYDFHVKNQDLSRLLLWEQLERPPESETKKRAEHHDGRVDDFLKGLDADDQDDALRLSLALVALAAWPSSNRQVVIDVMASPSQLPVQQLLEGPLRETVEHAVSAVVGDWLNRRQERPSE